jgi:hypothetical protein
MLAMKAKLIDASDWGVGIETPHPLEVGAQIKFLSGPADSKRQARVVHCRMSGEHAYRAGCEYEANDAKQRRPAAPATDSDVEDLYEILQISPNADGETIHRVYRLLAQRYHPDNQDTGDEKAFQKVLQAYRVLSDPEKRVAYDVQHQAARALRWKIFDKPASAVGVEGEKRKRSGVLSLLYTKIIEQPRQAGIMLRDIEELLGCPREHLEFTLWYLKQKELISGPENGRYTITAAGIDEFEQHCGSWQDFRKPLMLEEASSPQ